MNFLCPAMILINLNRVPGWLSLTMLFEVLALDLNKMMRISTYAIIKLIFSDKNMVLTFFWLFCITKAKRHDWVKNTFMKKYKLFTYFFMFYLDYFTYCEYRAYYYEIIGFIFYYYFWPLEFFWVFDFFLFISIF